MLLLYAIPLIISKEYGKCIVNMSKNITQLLKCLETPREINAVFCFV